LELVELQHLALVMLALIQFLAQLLQLAVAAEAEAQ
jgi:hypothetical protein